MSRAMKDSGEPWIGAIPQSWDCTRFATLFEERKEKVSDKDFAPLSVTKKGILPQLEGVAKTDNGDARKHVVEGDFVINSRSDRKGSSGISEYEGSVSLINIVLKPRSMVRARYVHHLLRSYAFQEEFYKWGHGIVDDLWTTNSTDAKNILLPLPPLCEQQRIADFLDAQTQEVDTAIVKTQESIEEYKKLKQAVITQAVTKGIRPNRPMKDSGVVWIGEMPAEWELRKLKYAVSVRKETRQYFPCSGTYIGLENLESLGSGIIPSESQYDEGEYAACETGDILYGKLRPYLCKCIVNTMNACCTGEFLVIKSFDGAKEYLRYYLLNTEWTKNVTASTYGAKMPRANSTFILDQMCFIPCLAEQQEIVAYLDERCGAIDEMIEKKQQIITELESYKKSLICEYVTGKREVPA